MKTQQLTALIVLAVPTVAAVFAEPAGESPTAMLEDLQLWKPVATVQKDYRPPPTDWHTVTDIALDATFSAPCELERSEQQEGQYKVVIYHCSVGPRAYIVTLLPIALPADTAEHAHLFRVFAVSNDASMLAEFKKGGIAVTLTPRAWVEYGDLRARQHTVTAPHTDFETRVVMGHHTAVGLMVGDAHENFPGDMDAFFDSLKLK